MFRLILFEHNCITSFPISSSSGTNLFMLVIVAEQLQLLGVETYRLKKIHWG